MKHLLLALSGIALIFISLFIFTKPAIWNIWDFTSTGQIGDTIGGITAPIINLIGIYLIFISFEEQSKANRIQIDALKEEKERTHRNEIFEKHINLLAGIKDRLYNLEFVVQFPRYHLSSGESAQHYHIVFRGINALDEYVLRLENNSFTSEYSTQKFNTLGILLNFQFIVVSTNDLITQIDKKVSVKDDSEFLLRNISLFYNNFLEHHCSRIIKAYEELNAAPKVLKEVKQAIDMRLKSFNDI